MLINNNLGRQYLKFFLFISCPVLGKNNDCWHSQRDQSGENRVSIMPSDVEAMKSNRHAVLGRENAFRGSIFMNEASLSEVDMSPFTAVY